MIWEDVFAKNFLSNYENERLLDSIIERLKQHEPIQYIIGFTFFFGMKLKVTDSVLIPRPETEELLEILLQNEKRDKLKVLDVGTGSGCIALALASKRPNWQISALDVSKKALLIATENAMNLKLKVDFIQTDFLQKNSFLGHDFDLIVSNPPYIKQSEASMMQANVMNFEPHQALFVTDEDALIFYREVIDFANTQLSKPAIYFEINQQLGDDVVALCKRANYQFVELLNDLSGNPRFVIAKN